MYLLWYYSVFTFYNISYLWRLMKYSIYEQLYPTSSFITFVSSTFSEISFSRIWIHSISNKSEPCFLCFITSLHITRFCIHFRFVLTTFSSCPWSFFVSVISFSFSIGVYVRDLNGQNRNYPKYLIKETSIKVLIKTRGQHRIHRQIHDPESLRVPSSQEREFLECQLTSSDIYS